MKAEMAFTLDRQVASDHCPECDVNFSVIRGSVYDDGQPFGLYLIALHGHCWEGRLGHIAIAILNRSSSEPRKVAASMEAIALPEEVAFSLVDWKSSPWRSEAYLGQMLSPEEVRSSPHRAAFFQIAEHIFQDLPEARAYLA
jgi:hypothetical protein